MALTLNYWGGRGLMEPARLMLAIAGRFPGAGYTDNRHSAPCANLECNLGRMPTAQVGNEFIGQSNAIYHYVASETGMLGDNNVQAAQIVSVAESVSEVHKAYRAIVPWGAEITAEQANKWFDEGATDSEGAAVRGGERNLTWFLGRIEKQLPGTAGFAVGNKLSLADVQLYYLLAEEWKADEAPEGTPASKRETFGNKARTDAKVAAYPKISASINAVRNNANAKQWWATRGQQGF